MISRAYTPTPFRAPAWLRGPHAQTVGGKFLRRDPGVPLERDRLALPDGDFVDLDFGPEPEAWGEPALLGESAARQDPVPVAVVLHGLEGSALRSYMRQTYAELLRRGIRPVGLNFRSCSGEPNRAARFYHSGDTGDLQVVVARLRERFGDRPLGAVGFSLGGNVLLKYLGESGVDTASARRSPCRSPTTSEPALPPSSAAS